MSARIATRQRTQQGFVRISGMTPHRLASLGTSPRFPGWRIRVDADGSRSSTPRCGGEVSRAVSARDGGADFWRNSAIAPSYKSQVRGDHVFGQPAFQRSKYRVAHGCLVLQDVMVPEAQD